MLMYTSRLRNLFKNLVEINQKFNSPFPASFSRFCLLAIFFYLGTGILEDGLFDVQIISKTLEGNSLLNFQHLKSFRLNDLNQQETHP